KYFPSLPYPGVTIKMLLNHRSGLPNYLYFMEKVWPRNVMASNTDVLNALIRMKAAKTANPGRRFNYCNTNYVLLALLVEKVAGVSFIDYMKTNFFDPLGMKNTFVHSIQNKQPVLASYQPNFAPWTLDFSDGPYGDKNIFSTPRDLLKWDQALYQGQILKQEMVDSAFIGYSNERPGVHNYGLGWRMLNYPNGKKVVYHNGHWHGFNAAFSRLIDEKATIIIISNKYNQSVYTSAKRLYEVFGNYNGKQDEEEN
ncbi:MAG TPA: serine hydrolase domain-containing protein, partial [Flavisolibacter sp.]|nr:serine hydrolase domain-containing protein [Flavisolibacter sp.]